MGLGTAYGKWIKQVSSQLPPVVYACGPETSLKQEMIERLGEQFPDENREVLSLYADESSPANLVQELQSQGMFSQSRWIILKQLQLKEGGQAQLARYFDTITDYLEDPEPDSVLFLFDTAHPYQKGRKTGGMVRAVENAGGAAVVFWEPFDNEIYQRVRKQFEENDVEFESGVVEAVVTRCEGKWSRIKQEVGKLVEWYSGGERINREDVREVVSQEESSDAYGELKQALTAGDCSRLLETLDDFYRQSSSGSEVGVTHTLLHYLNDLRDIRGMCGEGMSLKEALGEKGIPTSQKITGAYKKALKQTRDRYPKDFFRRSYQTLKQVKYRRKPFNRRSLEQYLLKTIPEVSLNTR